MKRFLTISILFAIATALPAKDINLRKYGAKNDGRTKVTAILQRAIDEVSASGGGIVSLTDGVFMTGPVELKSGVELHIDASAVLLGSPDLKDYPEREHTRHFDGDSIPRTRNIALIYADEAENIAIGGRGTIDCNGGAYVKAKTGDKWSGWHFERIVPDEESIPRAVFFAGCRNVVVKDITMTNQPAGWSYWIHDCDMVCFDGCKILADVRYPNNDGIHINSSRDVTVSNCIIETGDDSFVIRANNRSLKENKVCERVTVSNCVFRSWSSGVRIGWTNDGIIRNCIFSNIVMHDCSNAISCYLPDKHIVEATHDYGREATLVENISFSNIRMDEIYGSAIYVNVGSSPATRFAGFRNVSFSNIVCTCLELPYFCGREDAAVENIRFSDCSFEKCREEDFPADRKRHGAVLRPNAKKPVVNVKNLSCSNTTVTIR